MEEQEKTIKEIITPYLTFLANRTLRIASNATEKTFSALKTGFQWMYHEFIDYVVPLAAQKLPKILFITREKDKTTTVNHNSGVFEVMCGDQEDE